MEKRRIILNDVMLRESAQVAGGAMSPDDQLIYVKYLVENGIDMIEIGFPSSSKEEFAKCKRIVQYVKNMEQKKKPLLSGLTIASEENILAVKKSGCDVCHIYIPASDNLMLAQFDKEKYGDKPEGKRKWVVSRAVAMVKFAKSLGFRHIEYSPEDAARTSWEYLVKIVEAVIGAGATIINIPDTTGLRVGNEFGDLIKHLFSHVPNINDAIVSVHCHNDNDHATHNALQAVLNGAGQVEGTFYGLGERSGMTKFESLMMNITTREDVFGAIEFGFRKEMCVEIVNFVANSLGMPVPRHWVVVGEQNAVCSSGTHQAIEAKAKEKGMPSAYYAWNPILYGHGKVRTIVTNFSGKTGIAEKLKELGYLISHDQLKKISAEVNNVSASKRGQALNDRELTAIVDEIVANIPHKIEVKECVVVSSSGVISVAGVKIKTDGKNAEASAIGNGPIDAVMSAVRDAAAKIYPWLNSAEIILEDWKPVPITRETKSMGDVYVRIRVANGEDEVFTGRSVNVNISEASAQAYANCLSWCVASYLEKK
jgi:2-isopropylmalate synthase